MPERIKAEHPRAWPLLRAGVEMTETGGYSFRFRITPEVCVVIRQGEEPETLHRCESHDVMVEWPK